jgi:HEAT repeat protein
MNALGMLWPLDKEIHTKLYSIMKRRGTDQEIKKGISEVLRDDAPYLLHIMAKDPDICGVALGENSMNELLPDLVSAQTPRVCRIAIAKNLGKTTDPYTIEELQKVAADKDPAIRAAIAGALGEISSTVALPCLKQLHKDADSNVRDKAKAAIASIRY